MSLATSHSTMMSGTSSQRDRVSTQHPHTGARRGCLHPELPGCWHGLYRVVAQPLPQPLVPLCPLCTLCGASMLGPVGGGGGGGGSSRPQCRNCAVFVWCGWPVFPSAPSQGLVQGLAGLPPPTTGTSTGTGTGCTAFTFTQRAMVGAIPHHLHGNCGVCGGRAQ